MYSPLLKRRAICRSLCPFIVSFVSAFLIYGEAVHRALFPLAALTTLLAPSASAENQIWTNYELKKEAPAGLPVDLTLNGEIRFEPDGQITQYVLRPGISYALNDRLMLSGGYRYSQSPGKGTDQVEHRLWQQAGYRIAELASARITGRTRLEQRFREDESGTGWRVRQQISLEQPLAGTDIELAIRSELFVGLKETGWGNANGLQEVRSRASVNWAMAGLGWEAGYLNQIRMGTAGAADQTSHHIYLGLSKSF